MHIAIVIPGSLPVTYYGGTQRVVWYLAKALAELGNRVSLYADEVKGDCPFAKIYRLDRNRPFHEQLPDDVDIVHFNNDIFDGESLSVPFVVTLHGNGTTGDFHPNTIFVSHNHAIRNGCECYVYNGLDWSECPQVQLGLPRSGYHFLAKAAWRVKNVQGAIDVVKKIPQEHLVVLGGQRINIKMGFRCTLSPRIHFKGMVDDRVKYGVMQKSKGLLFPVVWHEPFGLAIIESLYAGSPVFATPYGAIPELISDSNLGFLTNSAAEMVEHLRQPAKYDPEYCHEYTKEHFSSMVMALNYMEKYNKVLRGEALNASAGKPDQHYRDLVWQK